jgi:predicted nucleic acid-binding protein
VTALLFPDTTVLVNFALIGRMDLLELAAGGGRGRWCGTVATECRRSARHQGLDDLEQVPDILGAPLYPETGAERLEVRHLRTELASPGDSPTDHLGEAETLAIIVSRPELSAFFVTDDRAAARLAASRSVTVVTTWDLLRLFLRHARITDDEAWSFALTLRAERRALPPGCRTEEDAWRWMHRH